MLIRIQIPINLFLAIIINTFFSLIIITLCPVDNKNKRFTSITKKRIRIICCTYLIVINTVINTISLVFQKDYTFTASLCLGVVVINQLIGILNDRKDTQSNETKGCSM